MRRTHVAVGPIAPRASWRWLGPHLAASLAGTCTVRFFDEGELPSCDVAVFVKERPVRPLRQAQDRGVRVLYMPVDFYRSRAQLEADAPFLGQCASLLVHSRVLGRFLAPYNAAIRHVDHPNLHGLAAKPPYRTDRTLLWIGDFLNLPYLLRWAERSGVPGELKLLTNARRTSIKGMAMTLALARRLGVELDVRRDRVNGIPMIEWDPATQRTLMAAASAAVDIKGGEEDFQQYTKPPAKAHQFVASGIPYATNRESSSVLELREEGFDVADVEDPGRWFSRDYWRRTQDFSRSLEERIAPEAVARVYRRCVEEAIESRSLGPIASVARAVPVARDDVVGEGPRWLDYSRAWRVLRAVGASWEDAAPYTVRQFLQQCRDHVPGYVTCAATDVATDRAPIAVSVLVDAGPDAADGAVCECANDVSGAWEIVAFGQLPGAQRAGWRFKSIARRPRRSLLRDRMLASGYAEGRYLAFVPRATAADVAWIREAVATLEARPQTAMVVRDRGDEADVEAGSSFVVRRSIWLALRGYLPGATMASPRCGDLDLTHRVLNLGYDVEPAPALESQRPRRTRPPVRDEDEIVVYTAITGGYDRLLRLNDQCVGSARQVAFLDAATRSGAKATGRWEVRDIESRDPDPRRQAKLRKVMPERFFPEARYSLWIDGNVALIHPFDIRRLIDEFLGGADLCIARHHARTCLYQEAAVCRARRLDLADVIDRQMTRYRREGFPAGYGLNEAPVILRRHTDAVREFDRLWWHEICRGSRRDQLSLNYVLWKTGLPIAEFPLPIQDNNGLFAKVAHARRRPWGQSRRPNLRSMLARMEAFHFGAPRPPESD